MQAIENPHVLIVDDDEKICISLFNYLTKEGVKAAYVHNAQDMRAYMISQPVDLLILDVMLPSEDGHQIARSIRNDSNIPIVMLTAKSSTQDKIKGMELDIDDYVTKPFDPKELLLRIQAILRRHHQLPERSDSNASHQVKFSNWILNLQTQQVTAPSGVKILLSPKEIRLLMAFLDNANKVLSREDILLATHNDKDAASGRSVDVQITRFRQKLKKHDDSIEDIIQTAHGAGYILTGPVSHFKA